MYEVSQRIERAAEGILENERLTADLDDAAAQVLLDWGLACAELIAGSTDGLSDSDAEEVMSPRLRATRRLMRGVNEWVAGQADRSPEGGAELLAQIIEQAEVIYGDGFIPPDDDRREAFLARHSRRAENSAQSIEELRKLLENPTGISLTDQG